MIFWKSLLVIWTITIIWFLFVVSKLLGKRYEKKKRLKKVIVVYNDPNREKLTKEIVIPNGWRFTFDYADYPKLIDENENVRQVFLWEPGYEITYTLIYENGETKKWEN